MRDATRLGGYTADGTLAALMMVFVVHDADRVESVWSSRKEAERHASQVGCEVAEKPLLHTEEHHGRVTYLGIK